MFLSYKYWYTCLSSPEIYIRRFLCSGCISKLQNAAEYSIAVTLYSSKEFYSPVFET